MAEVYQLNPTESRTVSKQTLDGFAAAIAERFEEAPHSLSPIEAPRVTVRFKEGVVIRPLAAAEWLCRAIMMPRAYTEASRQALVDAGLRNSKDGEAAFKALVTRMVETQPAALEAVAARFGAALFYDEVPENVTSINFGFERRKHALRDHLKRYGENFAHEVIGETSRPGEPPFETREDLVSFILRNWTAANVSRAPVIAALPADQVAEIMAEWLEGSDYDLGAANAARC